MARKDIDQFLDKAREEGFLTDDAVEECRKIAEVLREVDTKMSIDRIAVKKGFLTEQQSVQVQRALARRRVGRYEIVERLGAGGMGTVWRARDTLTKGIVAVKILADGTEPDSPAHQRFMREARLTCKLDHPNLVGGIEFGDVAGYTFLAMEFVPGESLEGRLKREPRIEEREAFGIAREVVGALEALQEFDLAHRDVKPGNIMMSAEGGVKLCDLGLTRAPLQEAEELGVEEVALGTAVYVSPEQVERPDHIDWRADVYSLGATLYHAVTGRPPFKAATPEAIARMHRETPPRDPREHVLELTAGAATVVLKMLHKDPRKRYETLEALAEDLEALRDGKPPVHTLSVAPVNKSTAPATAKQKAATQTRVVGGTRTVPRKKKSPVGLIVAGVIGLAVLGGVGFMLGGGDGSDPAGTGDSGQDTATTDPDAATTDPDTGSAPATDGSTDPQPPGPKSAGSGSGDPEPGGSGPRPDSSNDWKDGSVSAQALEQAISFHGIHVADLVGARDKFQFVIDRHAGTKAAARAEELLADVLRELGAAADTDLGDRENRAAALEASGALREAWSLFHEFPERFEDTAAAGRAVAHVKRLEDTAARVVADAGEQARTALPERRFEDAGAALERAQAAEIPSTRQEVDQLARDVGEAMVQNELERSREEPRFRELAGRALRLVATGDLAGGRELVKKTTGSLDLFSPDATVLASDLGAVDRVVIAARRRWTATTGQATSLVVPGRSPPRLSGKSAGTEDGKLVLTDTGGRRHVLGVDEICGPDVFALAEKALGNSPQDRFAMLLFALGRGELETAEQAAAGVQGDPTLAKRGGRYVDWVGGWMADEVDKLTSTAREARDEGRLDQAVAALSQARELAPSDATTATGLGRVLLESGKAAEAARVLEAILARENAPLEPRAVLGAALIALGVPDRARGELEAFLDGAPPDHPMVPEARRSLADVSKSLDAAEAVKLAKKARKVYQRKKWVEAEAAYARVLELDPDHADGAFALGDCYDQQKKTFAAFKQFTEFVQGHPKHKKVKEARKRLTKLDTFRRVNDDDRKKATEGDAAYRAKDYGKAIDLYRDALVWSPFLESARLGLAKCLLARHHLSGTRSDLVAAEQALDDLLVIDPDHLDALADRAAARQELGNHEGALTDAKRVLKVDKANPKPASVAGHAALSLGRLDRALAHFEESLRRKPNAEAMFGKGLVLERRGRNQEALDLFAECRNTFDVPEPLQKDLSAAVRRVRARLREDD